MFFIIIIKHLLYCGILSRNNASQPSNSLVGDELFQKLTVEMGCMTIFGSSESRNRKFNDENRHKVDSFKPVYLVSTSKPSDLMIFKHVLIKIKLRGVAPNLL